MNPVFFQLLRTMLEISLSQGNRLAVLEEEESRESAEEAATIQQAQALLEQLTMGVPTMPPGFAPSDI
ncbi:MULTISPECIES: hypothetical protein [unclassified Microcoleus]|uniref:hypothetical protein n=1 Tax=unclassified Microcoleus TaxID=2642155 RepID=UPI001D2712F7|nr:MULTISPECIES: hypothetical protein [unclassified Microcoleus]MCC3469901.1 hypothetical protein [Microcoleus sp. PH2017_06_SFM_O_A]TAE44175.1 MAG: hypothetical protein EAZ90_07195 [Oscillatoriales cyanobacterium]MCC3411069.1 hypothetical protein [Microcoleus sp. PH2017_02_FOX_O_A]MCC3423445.1 hypothetical protein [Microcoleus sp. PH2017_01_SCD_O_A]MCC3455942.1 hypothetical protein [Microcoleus sp. PH2017_08_TRC_O_A]